MNNNYENQEVECCSFTKNFGQKLMYLLIGGGLGAAAALLFAPKPGREIRGDIAELAGVGYDRVLSEANKAKDRTIEIYHSAMETGGEVRDVVAAGASAIKKEVVCDLEQIGAIVERSVNRDSANYGRPGIL